MDQKDGLSVIEMRQYRADTTEPRDRKGRLMDTEDGKKAQVFSSTCLVQFILCRVFLVMNRYNLVGCQLIDLFKGSGSTFRIGITTADFPRAACTLQHFFPNL